MPLRPLARGDQAAVGRGDGEINDWHSVSVSLNLFLNLAGLYHGICARDSLQNVIYKAADDDARFKAAVQAVWTSGH